MQPGEATTDERHDQFLSLYARHAERLRAFIRILVRDWHLAEEINQELSIALWKSFDRYEGQSSFLAWARGVARNKILHALRTQRRAMPTLSPEAMMAVERAYIRSEEREDPRLEALNTCMQQLDERSRNLLDLRYRDGAPLADVATHIDASLDAVTKSLARLRTRLADCVRQRMAADQ